MSIKITKIQEIKDDVAGEAIIIIADISNDKIEGNGYNSAVTLTLPEARELLEELNKKLLKE